MKPFNNIFDYSMKNSHDNIQKYVKMNRSVKNSEMNHSLHSVKGISRLITINLKALKNLKESLHKYNC